MLAAQIVPEVVPTDLIPNGFTSLESLAGTTLRIMRNDARIFVNGLPLRRADILVSDGIIHVVDRLFLASDFKFPSTKSKSSKKSMSMSGKGKPATKPVYKGTKGMAPQLWRMDNGKFRMPIAKMNMGKQQYKKPSQKPKNIFQGMH